MKTIKLVFILLLTFGCDNNDDMCNSIVNPDKDIYTADAKRLALRLLFETNNPYKDSVVIPDYYYLDILQSLWAVHNLTSSPERNYIIDTLKIHTYPDLELYNLVVVVNKNTPWVNLLRNNLPTGNDQIDELLCKYDLKIKSAEEILTSSIIFEIKAKNAINIKALIKLFKNIDGVFYAQENSFYLWNWNDVQMIKTDSYLDLIYSYNFGDCPVGCTCHHYWTYRIFNKDSVEFLGESGDQIGSCND